MAKVMIWPDIYKEQGHWLPCVNLANSLQAAGHTVQFMGIPDCEGIIIPYVPSGSFTTYYKTILRNIYPYGHSLENKLEPKDQRWKPAHLLPLTGDPLASPARAGALEALFTPPNKPDLLIGGYFTGLESLILHWKYGVPLVIITTFLRHPADDPAVHAKTKLVYMPRAVSQTIIDRSVPESLRGMSIDEFVGPLEAAEELIPCPRDFDFTDPDWVHGERVHYVEPMLSRVSLDGTNTVPPDNSDVPNTDQARLIYATSGSQVQDYEVQARQFFLSLIDMTKTRGMENTHLVLAVGDKLYSQLRLELGLDVNATNAKPVGNGKVHLFPWISQLDILKQADVVFMHGGLATIKESIAENVPIVIVPHGKDQHDNAMRIRRNGLGVVADTGSLSAESLRKLLTEATTSTFIKRKLSRMKGIFAAAEALKPSIGIINDVLT
jgi:Glycosyltransferase family 28 C-terminal domain